MGVCASWKKKLHISIYIHIYTSVLGSLSVLGSVSVCAWVCVCLCLGLCLCLCVCLCVLCLCLGLCLQYKYKCFLFLLSLPWLCCTTSDATFRPSVNWVFQKVTYRLATFNLKLYIAGPRVNWVFQKHAYLFPPM